MGVESSKPEASPFDKQLLEAPTESTDIDDDDDFRTPQGVSKLDGGAIADTTASVSLSKYLPVNHLRGPYCVTEMILESHSLISIVV